jgi:hypothetical protein
VRAERRAGVAPALAFHLRFICGRVAWRESMPTHERGALMTRRLVAIIAALALAAMTAGGGVAYAAHHAAKHHHAVHHKAKHASSESGETGTEASSEETAGDGPGGHEDPPGTEADHQFEGVE